MLWKGNCLFSLVICCTNLFILNTDLEIAKDSVISVNKAAVTFTLFQQ